MSDIGTEFAMRQREKEQNDAVAQASAKELSKRVQNIICSQLRHDTDSFNSQRLEHEPKIQMGCHDGFIMLGGFLPGAFIQFENGEVDVKPGQTTKEPVMSYERFTYFEHKGTLQFKNIYFGGASALDISGFVRVVFETLLPSGQLA